MSKMSEAFYDLLEMLEQGRSDQEIADELGFPVEAIAIWRSDAELMSETPFEELDGAIDAALAEQEDIFIRLQRDDPDADLMFPEYDEDSRYDYRDF
jgi:hypothetical protein